MQSKVSLTLPSLSGRHIITFIIIFSCSIAYSGTLSNKIVKDDVNKRIGVWNEPECSERGGICTPVEDCSVGNSAPLGLCPSQNNDGIECCYGWPAKEKVCQKLGGDCRLKTECDENVQISQATNCDLSEVCCALVV